MPLRQHQPERVVEERDPVQVVVQVQGQRGMVVDQRDVQLAVTHSRQQRLQVVVENTQPDTRSLVAQPR